MHTFLPPSERAQFSIERCCGSGRATTDPYKRAKLSRSGVFMEKAMKKYIVLVKSSSGKGGEFWNRFSKISDDRAKQVIEERGK